MKIFKETINETLSAGRTFDTYFAGKSFAVFDIETTGLSPAFSKIILTGILTKTPDSDKCSMVQFFASDVGDEKQIIEETVKILDSVDCVVTYNGRSFDMPFMKARAEKHGIAFDDSVYDIDLFTIARTSEPLRQVLPNFKQKTVEIYMGLAGKRGDEISGGESVELYNRYMENHSIQLENKILLHNHDDVIQLYKLMAIIRKLDFDRAMYMSGFPVCNAVITRIKAGRSELSVSAVQRGTIKSYISFPTEERPYYLNMNTADSSVEITIPCTCEADAVYLDARAILGAASSEIEKYPFIENGYLIVKNHDQINYLEINAFLILLFRSIDKF